MSIIENMDMDLEGKVIYFAGKSLDEYSKGDLKKIVVWLATENNKLQDRILKESQFTSELMHHIAKDISVS